MADKERVLITGATSGLGKALADVFAKDGHRLILLGRHPERLASLARELAARHGVEVETLEADLAQRDAVEQATKALESRGLTVDILVNNAGSGLFGYYWEHSPQAIDALLQVNIQALAGLTHRLLPAMRARGRGGVLNIASVAAYQPVPLLALYAASKSFVLSFSEALAHELRGSNVQVTTVCPGPFHSGFQSAAAMEKSRNFRGSLPDAEQVAQDVYRAWRRGRRLVVPGFKNRLLTLVARWVPSGVAATVARSKVRE